MCGFLVTCMQAMVPSLWSVVLYIQSSANPYHLVDPASSHMLVSKIKSCMSEFKLMFGEAASGSLHQLRYAQSLRVPTGGQVWCLQPRQCQPQQCILKLLRLTP